MLCINKTAQLLTFNSNGKERKIIVLIEVSDDTNYYNVILPNKDIKKIL